MAYQILGSTIHPQPIAETSTTARNPLGRIVQAVDPSLGVGEFIYLKGVGSTIVGSGVEYDTIWQTGLASIAINAPRPLAVAMSACVANLFGWYQIAGVAVIAKASATSFAAEAALGITSGLAVAASSALVAQNALVAVVAAAGTTTVQVMLNRPAGPTGLDTA
jgi:hypothetical protein